MKLTIWLHQAYLLMPIIIMFSHFFSSSIFKPGPVKKKNIDLWNGLPVAIRITDQLSLFSKKVSEFYIDKFNSSKERFL